MQKRYFRIIFTVLMVFGLVILSIGCSKEAENGVSEEQKYADPIAENILQSLNDDNYAEIYIICLVHECKKAGINVPDEMCSDNKLFKEFIEKAVSK